MLLSMYKIIMGMEQTIIDIMKNLSAISTKMM